MKKGIFKFTVLYHKMPRVTKFRHPSLSQERLESIFSVLVLIEQLRRSLAAIFWTCILTKSFWEAEDHTCGKGSLILLHVLLYLSEHDSNIFSLLQCCSQFQWQLCLRAMYMKNCYQGLGPTVQPLLLIVCFCQLYSV